MPRSWISGSCGRGVTGNLARTIHTLPVHPFPPLEEMKLSKRHTAPPCQTWLSVGTGGRCTPFPHLSLAPRIPQRNSKRALTTPITCQTIEQ